MLQLRRSVSNEGFYKYDRLYRFQYYSVTFKYKATGFEEYDLFEVHVCELFPVKQCLPYKYDISANENLLKIKLEYPFFKIGNIYCIEISNEDHSVVVNFGTIVVNEKACHKGKCIPFAFKYT